MNNMEERIAFNKSLAILVNNKTLIIEAEQVFGLHQTVISGKKFLSRLTV